jgi:hypothetical protein
MGLAKLGPGKILCRQLQLVVHNHGATITAPCLAVLPSGVNNILALPHPLQRVLCDLEAEKQKHQAIDKFTDEP